MLILNALISILFFFLIPTSERALQNSAQIVNELQATEHRLVKAWLEGDRKTVDSILAEDWSVIDLTGRVLTKSQVLQEIGSGERKIESGSVDDLNVRVFADTAVVTGRSTLVGSYRGQRASVIQRFTDVFIRRRDHWQIVASQGTQVVQSITK